MLSQIQREAIRDAAIRHPEAGVREIAAQFRCCASTVAKLVQQAGIKRERGSASVAYRYALARSLKL